MSNDNNLRTGLWKKDSNNGGAPYYGGKITIEAPGEYWVNLYKNDRKETDTQPDLNLQLKPKEATGGGGGGGRAQAQSPVDDGLPDF